MTAHGLIAVPGTGGDGGYRYYLGEDSGGNVVAVKIVYEELSTVVSYNQSPSWLVRQYRRLLAGNHN